MFKIGTRVVRLDERGVPNAVLGTILDTLENSPLAFVEWDGGAVSIISVDRLIPHQQLKAMFKHGPKVNKKGQLCP